MPRNASLRGSAGPQLDNELKDTSNSGISLRCTTMVESPPYQYPTLKGSNSFRILLLTGGNSNGLFAELIETTLNDNFPYEAISYVWGDQTKSHCLAIRGGKTLKITKSLYNALRNIRHSKVEDGARALWADGACINQEDMKERGQQVKLMAEIYRSARRVITYIGEDNANVEQGIDLAKKLLLCSKELDTNPSDTALTSTYRKYNVPNVHDPAWYSLRDFLSRPWYTRIWIIQESLHNNNMLMMCGKVAIPWEIFTQLSGAIEKGSYNLFPPISPNSERQVGAMGKMAFLRLEFRRRPMSFLQLLEISRDMECSDPRDRVFALSSLLKHGKINPDYEQSASRVFTEAACTLLSSHGLMVLSYAGVNKNMEVPSWVPDWSTPMVQIPVVQCRLFNSSGGTAPVIQINSATGSLRLSGKIHGKIVHATDTLRRTFVTGRMTRFAWASDQYLRLTSSGSAYPGGGSYLEAIWRTIISDTDPKNRFKGGSAPASMAQDFEAYVRPDKALAKWEASHAYPNQNKPEWMQPPDIDPAVIAAWEREMNIEVSTPNDGCIEENVFSPLRGGEPVDQERRGNEYRDVILHAGNLYRKFFTTEKGYIGLSVSEIAVGDVVAFFTGASVPFVLRSRSGTSEYLLVGDCYVHGLMNGKAFRRGSGSTKMLTLV